MPIKVKLTGLGPNDPWTVELQVATGLAKRLAVAAGAPQANAGSSGAEPDLPIAPGHVRPRADVVLAWRSGDLVVPTIPAGAQLIRPAGDAFVRLVWADVELDPDQAPPHFKFGWRGELPGVRVSGGAGHQLISAWFGTPGTTLDGALAHDTVELRSDNGLAPLWLRVVKSLFT